MKLNWNNLNKEERARYMILQMSPSYGGRCGYLPDDCSECPVCSTPVLGQGLCIYCLAEFNHLRNKLEGRVEVHN